MWAVALLSPLIDKRARIPRIQCDWHWSDNSAKALVHVLILNSTVYVNDLDKTKESFLNSIVAASDRAKHDLVRTIVPFMRCIELTPHRSCSSVSV